MSWPSWRRRTPTDELTETCKDPSDTLKVLNLLQWEPGEVMHHGSWQLHVVFLLTESWTFPVNSFWFIHCKSSYNQMCSDLKVLTRQSSVGPSQQGNRAAFSLSSETLPLSTQKVNPIKTSITASWINPVEGLIATCRVLPLTATFNIQRLINRTNWCLKVLMVGSGTLECIWRYIHTYR